MTTSSTYTQTRTANQIIDDVLWTLKAQDVDRTASESELTRCIRAINDIIYQLRGRPTNYTGFKMWQRESYTLTYVADYHYYIFEPGGTDANDINAQVPVEILGVKNQDVTYYSETPMTEMTFAEYLAIENKTNEGLPDKWYYEHRGATGRIYFNREPSTSSISGYRAIINYRQPLEIVTAGSNTIDAPDHWLRALKWLVAKEICPAYPGADVATVLGNAKDAFEAAVSFDPVEIIAYYEPERQNL